MKKLFPTLSLMLTVLIGSTGVSYALPRCGVDGGFSYIYWDNCNGVMFYYAGAYEKFGEYVKKDGLGIE
jgi:hypothetical protein